MKGDLAKELEGTRAAFAKELERERQQASRALEEFKASLSLAAEVNRQVATGRVRALGAIIEKSNDLLLLVADASDPHKPGEVVEQVEPLVREYVTLVRHNAHFFSPRVVERLSELGFAMVEVIRRARSRSRIDGDMTLHFDEIHPSVTSTCELIAALARKELNVASVKETE